MTSYITGFDRVNPCVSLTWPDPFDDRYWPQPKTTEPTDAG